MTGSLRADFTALTSGNGIALIPPVAGPDLDARGYVEEEFPDPGTEDFSYVLEEVPGCYLSIGACATDDPATAADNHSARAVFDDVVLPDCAAFLAEVAARRLSRPSRSDAG